MTKAKYQGRCLCGKISFEVAEFASTIGHCHCKMCQRFHGAAFSTFGEVKLADIRWLSGFEILKSYTAANHTIRQFCSTCGSSMLFSSVHNRQTASVEVALATLDNPDGLCPDAHLYTDSQAPWWVIGDRLPQYKQYRDGC